MGEVRSAEFIKGERRFQPRRFIAAGMADVHRRIVAAGYCRGSGMPGFAAGAGPGLGDVNHVHPFREDNGRLQFKYLKELAEHAGHAIDLTQFDPAARPAAWRRSDAGDHAAIRRCIRQALVRLPDLPSARLPVQPADASGTMTPSARLARPRATRRT